MIFEEFGQFCSITIQYGEGIEEIKLAVYF